MTLLFFIAAAILFVAGGFWEGCALTGLAILNSADNNLYGIRAALEGGDEGDA